MLKLGPAGTRRLRPLSLIVIGFGFVAIAGLMSPATLLRFGVMVQSITNPSELVRRTTLFEVRALRAAFSAVAGAFVVTYAVWPAVVETRLARWWVALPANNVIADQSIGRRTFMVMVIVSLLSGSYIVGGTKLLAPEYQDVVQREDGIIESLQVLAFLSVCALSAAALYRREYATLSRRIVRFAFVALFLLIAGEEVSWGQRLFGFGLPSTVREANAQQEANVHNLFGYFVDHVAIATIVGYNVGLPVLARLSPLWRGAMARMGLMLPSYGLATGFLLSSLFYPPIFLTLYPAAGDVNVQEFREFIISVGFVLLMIEHRHAWVIRRHAVPSRTRSAS